MSERIIHTADLSRLENNMVSLSNDLHFVSNQVDQVEHRVSNTQSELEQLTREFRQFIQQDFLAKNVQLSETRLVKIRQELEKEFGHYAEVRRAVIGILQAVDHSIVKKETINNASEEQMILAPRYWLAPCLIALSAWINDNKELANKALKEALKRNEQKTTLFFALVSRRIGRFHSSTEWLNRYLGIQNPYELERSIVILIDGFANGIFGPEARRKSGEAISEWIEELSSRPDFTELQMQQWTTAVESKVSNRDYSDAYPYLAAHSPQWNELNQLLQHTEVHDKMESMFRTILETPVTPEKSIAIAVDAILDKLIAEFDEEELPLRRKERLEELVLESEGDRSYAETKFSNEKSLEEKVDFTQLLTNFVMQPEVSKSSIATQKLGLALSKEWIIAAHSDFTAEYRSKKPSAVDIQLGGWTGTTDGQNEEELSKLLHAYLEAQKQKDIENARNSVSYIKQYIGMAAGALFGFLVTPWFLLVTAFFAWSYQREKKALESRIASIELQYKELYENQREFLRRCIAEYVNWQHAFEEEDKKDVKVPNLLEPVTVEQYSFSNYDSARSIIAR